jgi:hypothetical protein
VNAHLGNAFANRCAVSRVKLDEAGQVELKLKTPWRDGTTQLVMSPLEFMQRLAALVPRPRLHLIRFHGVLAPNAKRRSLVVPQVPPKDEKVAGVAASGVQCQTVTKTAQVRPARICWARLLKREFDIDMQRCLNCGVAQFKIVAAILERPVMGKILIYLGLDPQPPPKGRVRAVGPHFAA